MLDDYCNQTVTWSKKLDTNKYNESTYEDKSAMARVEEKLRRVRNKDGVEVVSQTTVFTPAAVQVDDLINGITVISVLSMTDLAGNVEGYEVLV